MGKSYSQVIHIHMFPNVNNTSKLSELFESIKNSSVPRKFTFRFLAKLGFKSSADRDFIPLLESLGFLNSNGKPSQKYIDFRDPKQSQKVLRDGFSEAYSELFTRIPKACNKTLDELSDEFISLTRADRFAADKMADTFLELCKVSNYDKFFDPRETRQEPTMSNPSKRQVSSDKKTFNININLPETTNEEVYRQIFKHLKEIL